MYYSHLSLHHFRNYDSLEVLFSPRVNIFVGKNGQGKTNIIEALYFISQGESFRYGDNLTFIKKGQEQAVLRTKIIDNLRLEYDLSVQILKSQKNFILNQKKTTQNKITEHIPVLIFSPESLSSIKDSDNERRVLIDQHLCMSLPQYRQILQNYRKALKTRNRILKDYQEGKRSLLETEDLLESIKDQFLKLAVEISFLRVSNLKEIQPELNNAMRFISHDQNVDISVEYVISGENVMDLDARRIQKVIEKRLIELHHAELSIGVSLLGPQKHDVKFLYNGNDSRFFCSQGQQRALILSYKMAQIVYHRKLHGVDPVLMLDDVLSELDSEKRLALISFLQGIQSQIFITTTDLNLSKEIQSREISVFSVENGILQKGQKDEYRQYELS